jgi:hypothetical protein
LSHIRSMKSPSRRRHLAFHANTIRDLLLSPG